MAHARKMKAQHIKYIDLILAAHDDDDGECNKMLQIHFLLLSVDLKIVSYTHSHTHTHLMSILLTSAQLIIVYFSKMGKNVYVL